MAESMILYVSLLMMLRINLISKKMELLHYVKVTLKIYFAFIFELVVTTCFSEQ